MKEKIKKIIKKFLIITIISISFFGFFTILDEKPTFADSGFSTSHSSGGSSRSRSSRSRSSSSRSRSSSSSSSSGDASLGGIIVFIIIIIVYLSIIKSKSRNSNNKNINYINIDDTNIEAQIKQILPNFNKYQFLRDGFGIYKDVQDAWMNFKLEDVKDKLTDELYNMYESQLATLEVKGERNVMKDITMQRSYLKDVTNQNGILTITTGYIIDQYDYIDEPNTGRLIRGNSSQKMRVVYEMKFRMSIDESAQTTHCPNCGAKLDINSNGICEYCGSKVVSENTKWVLTEKKALNQRYI